MLNQDFMLSPKDTNTIWIAQKASMTCFLNSLLREWFGWTYTELPEVLKTHLTHGIRIDLQNKTAWIPVTRYSKLGRHDYSYPASLATQDFYETVDYMTLAQTIVSFLPDKESSIIAKRNFLNRVADSAGALSEVIHKRERDFSCSATLPQTFVEAEQHLIVGHSFHPTPKSREGFTREDRLRYGPEYEGRFPLAWFAVDPHIVKLVSSKAFEGVDWIRDLVRSDSALGILLDQAIPDGFLLYPMNPWQAAYLQSLPVIQNHLLKGHLLFLGEHGGDWYPTSSVRAICRPSSPYMLKTSLNVRLTNSVRSLLLREVERGIQAHDVFESQHGQALLARYPDFAVLYEPAYMCLLDEAGQAIEESIVICRINPFTSKEDIQGLVLASLTQDNPFGHASMIGRFIQNLALSRNLSRHDAATLWFDRFFDIVIEPLVMAQAEYGILLGAHQQNILIGFAESLPTKLYFRDCQGTGYSDYAYQKLAKEVTSLDLENGNVLPSEMANTLFVYYIFINAAFNVITSLAQTGDISEAELLATLRSKLESLLAQNPIDPSCIHHILTSQKILHKGNFIASMRDINENTSTDPLSIYTAIKNPLTTQTIQENII